MKNRIKTGVIASFMLFSAAAYSQSDSLGLPGDDLDLDAVLSIFKQSTSVEDFEKRLNSAEPKVNNLDLNNDGKVDYLRVVDYGKDDFHSLVIQDPVSKAESQDIAVIEVVKKDGQTAHLQIVGDEAMYGKNYIIEPTDGTQKKAKSTKNERGYEDDVYNNNTDEQIVGSQVMVNVYAWPSVSYLYAPGYSYWNSPWYWGYYPGWYSPWAPYGGWYAYHRSFYGWGYGWYGYRTHYHAFPRAHNYYYGHRQSSGYVQKNATYGRRGTGTYNGGNRGGGNQQQRSGENRRVTNNRASEGTNVNRNSNSETRVRNNGGTRQNENRGSTQSNPTRVQGGNRVQQSGTPNMNRGQSSGGTRVNSGGGRSGGGNVGGGGGGRVGGSGGGGGGRSSGGGGGSRR